jgi:hypothetical protein
MVDAMKNGLVMGSSALGMTAGVIAVVGATGAVAAIGSTAGIAAIAVAGTAVAVGGGYYIYKKRQAISNIAQTKYSQASQLALGARAKIIDAKKSLAEYREAALKTKIYDEQITIYEKMSEIYSQRIDEISGFIASLEEAESMAIGPSEQKDQLHSLIKEMKHEIKALASERTRQAMDRAAVHEQDVNRRANQRETVDKMKQLSKQTAKQRAAAEEKSMQLRSSYENYSLSGQLNQVSPDQVALFKESLRASLLYPEKAQEVNEFLKSKGIETKDGDLLKAVVDYLTKKV